MSADGTFATCCGRRWMAAFRGEAEACEYEVTSPNLTFADTSQRSKFQPDEQSCTQSLEARRGRFSAS